MLIEVIIGEESMPVDILIVAVLLIISIGWAFFALANDGKKGRRLSEQNKKESTEENRERQTRDITYEDMERALLLAEVKEKLKKYFTKENLKKLILELLKKYSTKENILNNIFLISAVLVCIFFFFSAFEKDCSRCDLEWEWYEFKKFFWPCFALVLLHYVSKIAKSFHVIANQNKNK